MHPNKDDWITLRQAAELFDPPITAEALRLRLLKPNAPAHQKKRGRWLVSRNGLMQSNWLD